MDTGPPPLTDRAPQLGRRDPVTGLPNHQQFIASYQPRPGAQLVMLTLTEPRHFDQLLRAIGHQHAELFLRAGAQRLTRALRPEITLFQVGTLNFAFLLPQGASPAQLRDIRAAFAQPLQCGDIPVSADIALGLADCLDRDGSFILRAGLAAARDCRDTGRDWAHYDSGSDSAHQRGFLLLTQLAAAIAAPDQLYLNYQPKYALADGRPTSAEALLRWRHPVLGDISPAEFIPLTETTAHIHALTSRVLRLALSQACAWAAQGVAMNIAVNVSPHNLARRGFARQVATLLGDAGLPPARVELEFTEGALVSHDQTVLEELRALRETGVRIALDDFGTGFANFSYITHLPADILKIDKSFIRTIDADSRAALVVRTLIELAHKLNYAVVAEGIETKRACALLRDWGCDEGQGFYLSPPLGVPEITRLFTGA